MFDPRNRARSTLVLSLFTLSCAMPPAQLGPLDETPRSVFGGFVRVYHVDAEWHGPFMAEGELIAVSNDTLYVARTGGNDSLGASDEVPPNEIRFLAVARRNIGRVKLWGYDSEAGGVGLWTGVGAVSTITHGYGLVLSLPIWIIVGGTTTANIANAGSWTWKPASLPGDGTLSEDMPGDWSSLGAWSRFPQGLPLGVDRTRLRAFYPPPGWASARKTHSPAPSRTPGKAESPSEPDR